MYDRGIGHIFPKCFSKNNYLRFLFCGTSPSVKMGIGEKLPISWDRRKYLEAGTTSLKARVSIF
jgi:hypothetical protein